MNPRLRLFACAGALGLFLALFPGCYTQMGASKNEDEHGEGYGYNSQGQYSDTSYSDTNRGYDDGYYNNNYGGHGYYGFSYYYPSYYWPSYAFNAAYCDPWAINFGFNYGYAPYVAYPYNFAGYYSPYYPYGYGYYPYNGNGKYGYAVYPYNRGSRHFGDTRGVTGGGRGTTVATPTDASSAPPVTNVDRGGYNFPLGARSAPNPTGGTVHNSAPATVNHNPAPPTRGDAAVHGGARSNGRSGHAVRGWGQRRGGPPPARGTSQARPRDQDNPAPPPQSAPPRSNGGGREAGSQPRSSPAPRPEAPSGGGRSSGSTRGGRP